MGEGGRGVETGRLWERGEEVGWKGEVSGQKGLSEVLCRCCISFAGCPGPLSWVS